MAKKAKVVPIDEQLKNRLKQLITQSVAKSEINNSEAVVSNLENVLRENKEGLSKLFDENYQAFRTFMNCISEAVREHYKQVLTTIPSTRSNLRNSLIEECKDAANGIYDQTRKLIIEIAKEKVELIERNRGAKSIDDRGEISTYDSEIERINHQTQKLKFEEIIQKFTNRYLSVCAENFKTEKSPLIDASIPYTKESLMKFLATYKDDELKSLFDLIPEENKDGFAVAVSTQVKAHEEALNAKKGNLKSAIKGYDKYVESADKRVNSCKKKIEDIKSKIDELKNKRSELIDVKLVAYDLADKSECDFSEKLKALIEKINSNIDGKVEGIDREGHAKDLYNFTTLSVDLFNLEKSLEVCSSELKEAEQQKTTYETQRDGVSIWKAFDDKNKSLALESTEDGMGK